MRGERDGDVPGCGASPQREGVRDEIWVFGEKAAGSLDDSKDDGFKEKPAGYCSSCPNGAELKVCRKGLGLVAEIPVAGKVGLKALCGFDGKAEFISTDVSGRSKKESESRKLFKE